MKKILFLSLSLLTAAGMSAKVTLPSVLGSNMVLQQQCNANLWGKATPSKKVTVTTSWDNRKYTVQAAADSTWKTAVATPAAGGPYSIRISDGEAIVLDNVMIGEVWICSGQSNMQMPVMGFPGQPVVGSNEAILNGTNSDIRMFVVRREVSDRPLDDCNTDTGWQEATTESVAGFTAVGYFFGLNLYKVLGIPIGLIETDWGGTRIETWMDMETAQKVEQNQVEKDKNHQAPNKTAQLYNAMIHPLVNYTAQGFIWYQGESNIHTGNAHLYSQYMQQLVSLWRNEWGNQQMPFYYVQIAPFVYEGDDKTSVPLIVEQQLAAMDKIPYSGMASTTDIGSGPCIHPSQKIPVGERLALLALSKTYGKKGLICESPRFESVRFEDGKAIVRFKTEGTLGPDYSGRIKGFEIAGADKIFVPARAEYIVGQPEIAVSSTIVENPVAVRYAFRNVPDQTTLYNTGGLPAFPFRTDDWNDAQ